MTSYNIVHFIYRCMYRILIRHDLNSSDEFNANKSVKTNKNLDLYDYNDEKVLASCI